MAKVMSRAKVFSMLLLVFVYIFDLSNSADARKDQTNDTDSQSSVGGLFYNGSLTEKQKKSIVTIEFNCNVMDTAKNRTAVDSMYRNVHREILKSLNSRKSDITTVTTPIGTTLSTSSAATPPPTPIVITMSTTRATTTTGNPVPDLNRKRKRRQQTTDGDSFDAKDLHFVPVDPETDDRGVLVMSLLLIVKETDNRDCGIILYDAANQTHRDGTLHRATGVPVVAIHRGLPGNRKMSTDAQFDHTILIWPLVILGVILVIVIIGCVVYWKKRQGRWDNTQSQGK
jgi:hypothetical protein